MGKDKLLQKKNHDVLHRGSFLKLRSDADLPVPLSPKIITSIAILFHPEVFSPFS